jgi:hypothetical protein
LRSFAGFVGQEIEYLKRKQDDISTGDVPDQVSVSVGRVSSQSLIGSFQDGVYSSSTG